MSVCTPNVIYFFHNTILACITRLNCFELNLQILEKFFTNSTKIKFVNFVGNYSYKVNNIEKIYFASCKVFTVLVRKIQFSGA
jgi:hypothetical protein